MAEIDDSLPSPKPLSIYVRPFTMAVFWFSLSVLGTAFYCFGGQPSLNDGIAFGCALAISTASAAMAAFWIGGRRRWAVELAVAVFVVSGIFALLLGYFLWLDPSFARRKLNLWQFRSIQQIAWYWPGQIARFHGPLGAAVGFTLGAITGLLTILSRRRSGWAIAIALTILYAVASDVGRRFVIDQVAWIGLRLRFLFLFTPNTYADDQISITAMILGATVGSVISGIAMYLTRRR